MLACVCNPIAECISHNTTLTVLVCLPCPGDPGLLLGLHQEVPKPSGERSHLNHHCHLCSGHRFDNLCPASRGHLPGVLHEEPQRHLQGTGIRPQKRLLDTEGREAM